MTMAREKATLQQEVEIEERTPQAAPQPQTPPQPQQQPRGKVCYGDCFACSLQQAVYCASTHARLAMRMVEQISQEYNEVMEAIGLLTEELIDIKKQITIPDELINPLKGQA